MKRVITWCRIGVWFAGAWLVIGSTLPLAADEPSVSYIFPAGGQRGTSVTAHVGGHYLHGSAAFDVRGRGLTADDRVVEVPTRWFEGPLVVKPASQSAENYPRDHAVTISIAPDAPLGEVLWRVWTSQGGTTGRPFVIGDLPEVLEAEIDGRPLPQMVTLPITVNGRMFPREDVDIWAFEAKAGDRITCEVRAARIASPLDACLEARGPSGERLAENDDHFDKDSWLRFTVPTDGTYQVSIWDAEQRGLQDFVYRLTISKGPYVDHVFPLGGRRGEQVPLQLVGQHVPDQSVAVTIPPEHRGPMWLSLPVGEQATNAVLLDVSDLPEVIESTNQSAHDIRLPILVNGCIRQPGEVDRWVFTATKGQRVECALTSARLGSLLDGVITILDETGKPLLHTGSTTTNRVEPRGEITIPADGRYTVEVRDVFASRGGAEYGYRMQLGWRSSPDFTLQLASDAVTLVRGKEARLKVALERQGGFTGDITLQIPDLPAGIVLDNTRVPGSATEGEIVLRADATAPTPPKIQGTLVHVDGTANLHDRTIVRRATTAASIQGTANDTLLLAVAMPTPFALDGGELQLRYAARGTVFRRQFDVVRNGYRGPLTIQLADRQIRHLQGLTGPVMQIGADAQAFEYPVNVPTWFEMNRTSRTMVMAIGEVTDFDGSVHQVSFSSGDTRNQIALLTAPCPMSLRAERPTVAATPETTQDVRVFLSRGELGTLPATVDAVPPAHLRDVTWDPLVIPADANSGTLRIRFGPQPGPFTMPLVIRATVSQHGDPVIAETSVELVDVSQRRPLSAGLR